MTGRSSRFFEQKPISGRLTFAPNLRHATLAFAFKEHLSMLAKLLTEFLGTMFLVLTISLVVSQSPGAAIGGLAIGLALMVCIYMGGAISGAHYNPAVTLAAIIRGAISPVAAVPYMIVQIVGALVGAYVGSLLVGKTISPTPGTDVSYGMAFLAELLFTFLLALVVLNVATSKKTSGNGYFGVAIGMVVTVAAVAIGPISGACLNPAVAIGLCSIAGKFDQLGLYLPATFAGAALAAVVFKLQHPGEPAAQ